METERHSPRYSAIEAWSPGDILEAMIEGQFAAVAAVRAARPALEDTALAIEPRLRDGGRLAYAGAGTSGRLAVQDGAELMPTFSWPQERLLLLIAGGREALVQSGEGAGDDSQADEHEGRHHPTDRAEFVVVAGDDPARQGLPRADRRPQGRQQEAAPAQRENPAGAYGPQPRGGARRAPPRVRQCQDRAAA